MHPVCHPLFNLCSCAHYTLMQGPDANWTVHSLLISLLHAVNMQTHDELLLITHARTHLQS